MKRVGHPRSRKRLGNDFSPRPSRLGEHPLACRICWSNFDRSFLAVGPLCLLRTPSGIELTSRAHPQKKTGIMYGDLWSVMDAAEVAAASAADTILLSGLLVLFPVARGGPLWAERPNAPTFPWRWLFLAYSSTKPPRKNESPQEKPFPGTPRNAEVPICLGSQGGHRVHWICREPSAIDLGAPALCWPRSNPNHTRRFGLMQKSRPRCTRVGSHFCSLYATT